MAGMAKLFSAPSARIRKFQKRRYFFFVLVLRRFRAPKMQQKRSTEWRFLKTPDYRCGSANLTWLCHMTSQMVAFLIQALILLVPTLERTLGTKLTRSLQGSAILLILHRYKLNTENLWENWPLEKMFAFPGKHANVPSVAYKNIV